MYQGFIYPKVNEIPIKKHSHNEIKGKERKIMAKKDAKNGPSFRSRVFEKGLNTVGSILDQLSISLYGTDMKDETDDLNARFNQIMGDELKDLNNGNGNDFNSFIGRLYSNDKDQRDVSRRLNTELMLDGGAGVSPAEFITERYRNQMLKQADAHEIAEQLIELGEARSTMCDAILSADSNTGRISRKLVFHDSGGENYAETYTSVVEAMEKHFDLQKKTKDFIMSNLLDYGSYYVYTIPYHMLFNGFMDKYKNGRNIPGSGVTARRFFESADGDATVENITDKYLSDDEGFFTEAAEDIMSALQLGPEESGKRKEVEADAKALGERISVCTDAVPLPILEYGMEATKVLREEFFTEDGKKKSSKALKSVADDDVTKFLKKHGNAAYADEGLYTDDKSNSKEDFEDMKDVYMKLCPPTTMFPVKIMDETLFYIYIMTEDATPLNTVLNYSNQMKSSNSTNRLDNLVEDISNRIVSKFNKKFLEENKEFKSLIAAALDYYELGNRKVHFQVVPKEYVTEFKINVDEEGHGHSMLEKSLFYAKLYLMILMFKIITIITKSNDQTINYLRTSGIDKNVFNKAQEIARQKAARRITLNDMFSYTGVLNKVAAGSEIFMPMGKNNEKPLESEILSGQQVEMHNDLLEMLRNNYILGTGVPSAIMNYLNEADFAKSIETANTKMCGRVMSYQMDVNPSLTELYRKLLKFSTSMPEAAIQALDVVLPEPKGNSNVVNQELINNYTTVEQFLSKIYFGESPDDDAHVKRFLKEVAKLHLPAINFAEIDDIFERTKTESIGDKVNGNEPDMDGI